MICCKLVYFNLTLNDTKMLFTLEYGSLAPESDICSIIHTYVQCDQKMLPLLFLLIFLIYEHHDPTKINLFLFSYKN